MLSNRSDLDLKLANSIRSHTLSTDTLNNRTSTENSNAICDDHQNYIIQQKKILQQIHEQQKKLKQFQDNNNNNNTNSSCNLSVTNSNHNKNFDSHFKNFQPQISNMTCHKTKSNSKNNKNSLEKLKTSMHSLSPMPMPMMSNGLPATSNNVHFASQCKQSSPCCEANFISTPKRLNNQFVFNH